MGNALEKLQEGAQLLADLHHVFNDTHKTRGKVFCIWIRSLTQWGLLMKNCYTFTLISILYLVVFCHCDQLLAVSYFAWYHRSTSI